LIDWNLCFLVSQERKDEEDGSDNQDMKSMMKWGRLFSILFYGCHEIRFIDDHMNLIVVVQYFSLFSTIFISPYFLCGSVYYSFHHSHFKSFPDWWKLDFVVDAEKGARFMRWGKCIPTDAKALYLQYMQRLCIHKHLHVKRLYYKWLIKLFIQTWHSWLVWIILVIREEELCLGEYWLFYQFSVAMSVMHSSARQKKAFKISPKALFASFDGRGRKGLGGEGKGRKGREKVFPLFES